MLTTLAVAGYRSLCNLVVPLEQLTVITGANGSGKSSLYRSLRLLAATARDGAIAALAREGGLASTLWAGPERPGGGAGKRSTPIALKLGFASDDDGFGYAIDFGIPTPSAHTMFNDDPEIKAESVWSGPILRPATLLTERQNSLVRLRGDEGWRRHERSLPPWASVLGEVADPATAPELLTLRDILRSWRFYDSVRTDADAPARRSPVATRTPVLSGDGADLAAALQTVRELGDPDRLDDAISAAFPGSRLTLTPADGGLSLGLRQPGLLRPLTAPELSDGTLRYLVWVAALLSPRPAPLLVLNEPETSLHPSLLEPLAELIAGASSDSQIVVVSHAAPLVDALAGQGALRHELEKRNGETVVAGRDLLDQPAWKWPSR
ncbi:AAA family ATPase [Marisediminicola sp. LYQ134]|uniref:AAA family ATPase n=1 Tax=Marisediminicola sp. LYQ134 TaxID=3391061 RepID=UPI003983C8A5